MIQISKPYESENFVGEYWTVIHLHDGNNDRSYLHLDRHEIEMLYYELKEALEK